MKFFIKRFSRKVGTKTEFFIIEKDYTLSFFVLSVILLILLLIVLGYWYAGVLPLFILRKDIIVFILILLNFKVYLVTSKYRNIALFSNDKNLSLDNLNIDSEKIVIFCGAYILLKS